MKEGWSYGGVESDQCVEDFIQILDDCFAIKEELGRKVADIAGPDALRFVRGKRGTKAALLFSSMGQYFGGRRVPMTGIGGVGTLPAERGGGVATVLMNECVRELRTAGVPLSVLYPATLPLYRRAGYEHAGSRMKITVPIAKIGIRERDSGLELREATEENRPALRELYDREARHRPGFLSRNEYIWTRVWSPIRAPSKGFVVEEGGAIEGYLYLTRTAGDDLFQNLTLTDFIATTPRAARRLFSFLGDYSSLGTEVTWFDGPGGSLLQFLPRISFEVSVHMHWMLRITDVPAALEARGYSPELEGELHLAVEDPVIEENSGNWLLRVTDGRASVERGGRGDLQLSERGLASLYSGFMGAESIALCEMARGEERALATATALFAGPAPGMGDMF